MSSESGRLLLLTAVAAVLLSTVTRADLTGEATASQPAQASDALALRAANEKLALIRVCVKYLWRCAGYAEPLPKRPSNPFARCTRYCAQERIYN